eukprot:366134-Chlamydomonas_euryale.AAC.18
MARRAQSQCTHPTLSVGVQMCTYGAWLDVRNHRAAARRSGAGAVVSLRARSKGGMAWSFSCSRAPAPSFAPPCRLNGVACVCGVLASVHVPEGLSYLELDIIKATAQFTARNGKAFLTGLSSREHTNPLVRQTCACMCDWKGEDGKVRPEG